MSDSLLADLRYAFRRLTAAPGFTLAAASCIAIGIAANTAIFGLADALLLRPLAGVTEPAALVEIGRSQDGRGSDTFAYPALDALRESSRTVEVAGWTFAPMGIGAGDSPAALMGLQVTDNYFDVLGVPMQLGRGFAPGEAGAGGTPSIVVISDALWRDRFETDPAVIGREVRINGTRAAVVGVAAPGFTGSLAVIRADAWVPLGMEAGGFISGETLQGWRNNMILGVGRLADGASLGTARAELDAQMAALVDSRPDELEGQGVVANALGTLPVDLAGMVQLFMVVLSVVVGLVLAVACVNVAGMILARSLARRREVAVRSALGAGRGRIVQQLLTESFLLVGLGGVLGTVGAAGAMAAMRSIDLPIPPPFDIAFSPQLDARVMTYALLATGLAGLFAGLGPAARVSRADLVPALKGEGAVAGSRLLGRRALTVAQVALTVVLVVTAGLFVRALNRAAAIDLGFDATGVYAIGLDAALTGLDEAAGAAVLANLAESAEALPGVTRAGLSVLLPLGLPSNMGFGGLRVAGHQPPDEDGGFPASTNIVGPGYFETMGIDLVAGRDFDELDNADAARVAIINAHAAERFWNGDAVGQVFTLGETEYRVKAVAADSKYQTLTEETPFFIYVAHAQRYSAAPFLVARIDGDTAGTIASIRATAATIAPDLPILEVVSLRSYADLGLLPQRVAATLGASMGAIVILLAGIGMYSVTAQMVRRRHAEIGVRLALGAEPRALLGMVVRQGMREPIAGLVLGLAVAGFATRFMAVFLYGISPLDPVVFLGGSSLLLAAALAANWLPARSAAQLDPVRALRAE
ncbi:MAG: FtsX-like permease family protein [Acidobacteria bacterium]|nr:FtsX-like permease family protein [Acidobacteriota bacterium]